MKKKEIVELKGKRPVAARDEKFVDLVAKGESPVKAYVRAGFKNTKNARTSATQKLANSAIQSALDKRRAYFRSIADIEAKDIIGAQAEIAFASIEDALDDQGRLNFVKAKRNGSAKLIKKISRAQTQYGETVSVEFYSRSDALGQLTEILGLKQMPRENELDKEYTRKKSLIEQWAKEKGVAYHDELRLYLEKYADGVPPEITQRLASELVQ